MTLYKRTLDLIGLIGTHSVTEINDECRNAVCGIFIDIPSVVWMNAIVLSGIWINVLVLSIVWMNVIVLSVIWMNVIVLSVI